MSRIIERVPTAYRDETWSGTTCDVCGCGNSKDTHDVPCTSRFATKTVWNPETHEHEVTERGPVCKGTRRYEERTMRVKVPGTIAIRCDCGERLDAMSGSFTITCDRCGADYNGSGSRLAPRSQWGEETGETAADIMMSGDGFDEDY